MTENQQNRKNMMDATVAYMDEHAAKWQEVAIIGNVKNQLDGLLDAIAEAAETQAQSQVTYGKTKLALKKTIAVKADILNDLVEVHALMEGDDELARQMSDNKSELYRLPYEEFFMKVKFIIQKATELQEALSAEYGMTAEQLTGLQSDVDQLLALNGKPREYQIKSGVATQSLEDLFSQTNELLTGKLDNLMKIFTNRDANFYAGYQRARMIVD